jgi:uncharacterized protein (UPF0276 family)
METILSCRPDIAWFEVHPENYMADHRSLARLGRVREHYPLSLHGVALSLATAGRLDVAHLARLKQLIARLDPFVISEHLAWSSTDGAHLNDLLPLPYTEEALDTMAAHVDQVQNELGRQLLIENPSRYLHFRHSTLSEPEFLTELVRRTDCGLLCDLNNIFVSARNIGIDPESYLDALPGKAIGEFHVAGHATNRVAEVTVLIDDHASPVCGEVWSLYGEALRRFGNRPTLVEWDANLPPLDVLLAEAEKARHMTVNVSGACHANVA